MSTPPAAQSLTDPHALVPLGNSIYSVEQIDVGWKVRDDAGIFMFFNRVMGWSFALFVLHYTLTLGAAEAA